MVVLRPGDVIGVGQDGGGNCAFGGDWQWEKKESKQTQKRRTGGRVNYLNWEREQPAAFSHIILRGVHCSRMMLIEDSEYINKMYVLY